MMSNWMMNAGKFGQPLDWRFFETLDDAKAFKTEFGGSGTIMNVETVRSLIREKARYNATPDAYTQSQIDALAELDAPAFAEAALVYRQPVAAFVAPVPVAKPHGFASGKLGPVFQYRAPNLRAGARCRFEARNGFEGVGYITGIAGDAVTIRYRNAQGEQAIEDVPAYRVWPYGRSTATTTTWGAREKEIRDRAFEKGSDD